MWSNYLSTLALRRKWTITVVVCYAKGKGRTIQPKLDRTDPVKSAASNIWTVNIKKLQSYMVLPKVRADLVNWATNGHDGPTTSWHCSHTLLFNYQCETYKPPWTCKNWYYFQIRYVPDIWWYPVLAGYLATFHYPVPVTHNQETA